MSKRKFYMTPAGSIKAASAEEAAAKKNVPVESVFVLSTAMYAVPARCKAFYN